MAARIIGPSIEGMIADLVSSGLHLSFAPDSDGKWAFRVGSSTFDGISYSGVALNETGKRLSGLEVDKAVSSAWRVYKPVGGYPAREEPC